MRIAHSVMASTAGWLNLRAWLRVAYTGWRVPRDPALVPPKASDTWIASGRIRVQSAEALLATAARQALLQDIEHLTRVMPAHFETLYRQALRNYAFYVQQLPASEAHHHPGLGGLLDHGLEAAVFALKLRRAHLLPAGGPTEVIDAQADLWSYACFATILLHDIGKPAVDHEVTLFDKHGRVLGPWDPWAGPMRSHAYEARFLRDRNYRMHQHAAPLLARFIVPPEGVRWLTSERAVLAAWLAAISGMPEDAGPLGRIVEEADRLSTVADLSGGVTRQSPTARVRPLHERLITGLRYLMDRGELPLNRPGAAGWLVGEELWLVVETALDAVRAHLIVEGQCGIPGDNRRLMDELQSRGVLVPNGDRAVWSARVILGEWQQELTLLRFPVSRLWPDPATRPDACHGTIAPLAEGSHVAAVPQVSPAVPRSVIDDPPRQDVSESSPPRPLAAVATSPGARKAIAEDTALPSPAIISSEPPPATAPIDLGQAFLSWLKAGLVSGTLPINTVNARVHRVKEGTLLVSPGIFQDFGNVVTAPWNSIQKRFQKLRLHRKTPGGFNIWNYTVVGERRTHELKGIVLDDPEKVFGPGVTLPPPNPHVVLVQGKKG